MNEKRRERTKELYIKITCDLIRKQGMNAVTIRNISDEAGYNSATLYSYFNNLSELIFHAHMKFEDELMELFEKEIREEKITNFYDIWPHMYMIMFDYYLKNPNIFDCELINDYAAEDEYDVKKQRIKQSGFNFYVMRKLNQIAQETGRDISLIMKINDLCVAQVTGTVLLLLKKRLDFNKTFENSVIEDNLRKLIHCFMEDK